MPSHLLVDLIVSAALGGGVGWVTNAIAINMLFKKYWKWGGVIEDHYQEFIENMSHLVEDDLVNVKTLKTEFESEAFKQILQKWVEGIVKVELPANSGTIKLEDIPGIEESVNSLLHLIEDIELELMNGIYKTVGTQKVSDLISKGQYNYILNTNLGDIFKDKKKYEDSIKSAFGVFLDGRPINTLISGRAVHEITNNIVAVIEDIDLLKYDSIINSAYEELILALNIDGLLVDLQNRLGGMCFADFAGTRSEALSRELLTKVLDFIKSNEGQALLSGILKDFLREAKKIDLKISDVVSSGITYGIIRFCKEKMPGIIDRVISFIRQTQTEIEGMVNTTVDRVLDRDLGGKIIKWFKDIFIGNLASQFRIVDKVTNLVKKYGEKAGEELSSQLINLLRTNTIGDIVSMIEEAHFIKIDDIVELVNSNLRELPRKNIDFVDSLLQRPIGKTLGGIDLSIIKTHFLPMVLVKIKADYLYSGKFRTEAECILKEKIQEIAVKSLSEIFNVYNLPITLDKNKILKTLLNYWENLSEMKFQDIIGSAAPKEVFIKKETFRAIWKEQKERPMNDIYAAVQKKAVYKKVADGLVDMMLENLDGWLGNRVAPIVKTELSKLYPTEINDMVHDFMGTEMKIINILGAVLGAIIGLGSAAVVHLMKVPSSFMWQILLGYGGIFALVGIFTNWLAIKMLFRPYKGWFGINKSPFIGVVAANKPRFAANIGSFVKKRMLNDDALQNYFADNKDVVQNALYKNISESNYAVIDKLVENDKSLTNISLEIYSAVKKYLVSKREELSNSLADKLRELIKDGSLSDVLPQLQDLIIEKIMQSDIASMLTTLIEKKIDGKTVGSYRKLVETFSDTQFKNIIEPILRNLNREITMEKTKKIIDNQNDTFVNYVTTNSIEEFMGKTVTERFKDKILPQFGPLLKKGVKPIIDQIQREELSPHTKLSDVFGGGLSKLIDNNISYLITIVCKEISAKKGDLINNIKDDMPWYASPAKDKVAPVVNELIDWELPQFLHRKEGELVTIANKLLENRLSNIGFTGDSLRIEHIENAIKTILDSPHVKNSLASLVGSVIKEIVKLPIGTLLAIININQIDDIVRRIEPLLETAVNHIKDNLEREEIIEIMARLVKSLLLDIVADVKVEDILANIELEKELRSLVTLLKNDKKVVYEISYIIGNILETVERNPAFYDDAVLRKDVSAFIDGLESAGGWKTLEPFAVNALKECFKRLNSKLSTETKNAVINEYLVTAAVNSCIKLFAQIIHIINVEMVVEREVNNMHPANIEKLFYKFAGTYFRKITIYGWIGIFGGLLSYVISFILSKFIP